MITPSYLMLIGLYLQAAVFCCLFQRFHSSYSEVDRSMGHFRRYYKKELIERVKGAGFEVEKARYFDLAGIIPWYVNFVLLKNSFSARSVTAYDRVVVPPMRLFEKLLVPPIGKNVLLVARKT